jgi:hypothetical protein
MSSTNRVVEKCNEGMEACLRAIPFNTGYTLEPAEGLCNHIDSVPSPHCKPPLQDSDLINLGYSLGTFTAFLFF